MAVPKLTKAANGYFYACWFDGSRSKRQSMGTQAEAEAQRRFAYWLINLGDVAKAPDGQNYTVAELWQVYERKHVQVNVVPLGRETIFYAWKNIEPHFGPSSFTSINQDQVDRYIQLRLEGRIGRIAKLVTIRRELLTLIAALNFCAKPPHSIIEKARIPYIKPPPPAEPRDKWLKIDEIQRLLDAAATKRVITFADKLKGREKGRLTRGERFIWLASQTAARKQAIQELTWDRVDFETGVIFYDVPGRKKTKKRRAAVTISSALRPILERAYAERDGRTLVLDTSADIWPIVRAIATRAGFSKGAGVSPHTFRHSAATHMARRGVPLWSVAKVLGDTMATVERVYGHWVPDRREETVDMISSNGLRAPE